MKFKGKLYLIPTTLGENEPLEVLPIPVKKVVEKIDYYIVENEKMARRFIKKIQASKSQSKLKLFPLNKFTREEELSTYLDPCNEGISIGLMSDAGTPGIADPGAKIVSLAHKKNIQVVPLVGPSSILLGMMSSGMNGQNFCFNGYLPIDKIERKAEIKRLEKLSKKNNQSQIFIETPYRNDKMFLELKSTLSNKTRLCIAADITLSTEYIRTKTIDEWKKTNIDLKKKPVIFIIHKD